MESTTKNKKTKRPSPSANLQKLKLLVTVVNRNKTEFYLDYLHSLGLNMQTAVLAQGTAKSDMLYMLGLEESDKSVIFSVLPERRQVAVMHGLEEKFHTVRKGKGIAFTVPLSSVIGVAIYRFLSDNRTPVKEDGQKQ